MAAREKPLEKEMAYFVRAHLGRGVFAPFTGTDYRAWNAWCHLLRLYGVSGDTKAIDALRATLECAQRKECIWEVFVQTIPGALDWGYVKEIWPRIVDAIPPTGWPLDLGSSGFRLTEGGVLNRHATVMQMPALERGEGGTPVRRHGLGWS